MEQHVVLVISQKKNQQLVVLLAEQVINRKAQIVQWTIALSGPKRSVDNQQLVARPAEQQTKKRSQQLAAQHVVRLVSKRIY